MNFKPLIKTGTDVKEVVGEPKRFFLDGKAGYETTETLTQFKERAVLIFRQRYLKEGLKWIEHNVRESQSDYFLPKATE